MLLSGANNDNRRIHRIGVAFLSDISKKIESLNHQGFAPQSVSSNAGPMTHNNRFPHSGIADPSIQA
jgi:hypothetical protein